MSFFNDASGLPWKHVGNLETQLENLPSFLGGEVLFISCAFLCLLHALWKASISGDKALPWIWLCSWIAGTANDIIFMAIPQVDNFWHAQGWLMITPRLPFYIPCVYISFLYIPTVSARRLNIPSRYASCALAGLLGMLFYYPYDIVGPKFLWWTWYDSDPMVAARIYGAPTASTLWTLTFVASFSEVTRRFAPPPASRSLAGKKNKVLYFSPKKLVLASAVMTTPLMCLMMTPLNLFFEQNMEPGYRSLGVGVTIAMILSLYALLPRLGIRSTPRKAVDTFLLLVICATLAALVSVGIFAFPEEHKSLGVHQEVGTGERCDEVELDLMGNPRQKYLCPRDLEEPFDFSCVSPPADGDRWYTVCGKPHGDDGAAFQVWFTGLASLATLAATLFAVAHFCG